MDSRHILAALIVAVVVISGCAQKGEQNQTTPAPSNAPPQGESVAIAVTSAPAAANAGTPFTISWKVEGAQKAIESTAVYYGDKSYPGTLGEDAGPDAAGYAKETPDIAGGAYQDTFTANITPEKAGSLYFRVHALVDGRNYWTGERSISVKPWEYTPQTREFMFNADDYGFYYANNTPVYFISVVKGDTVEMTLDVRTAKVSRGSLDFRGCGQNATGIKAGESLDIRFTATGTCAIASYWPNASLVKSAIEVIAVEPPKAPLSLMGRVLYYLRF